MCGLLRVRQAHERFNVRLQVLSAIGIACYYFAIGVFLFVLVIELRKMLITGVAGLHGWPTASRESRPRLFKFYVAVHVLIGLFLLAALLCPVALALGWA